MRESLIQALFDPEICLAQVKTDKSLEKDMHITQNIHSISFSESDLLLGTTLHNRPLYITANFSGCQISTILIDPEA